MEEEQRRIEKRKKKTEIKSTNENSAEKPEEIEKDVDCQNGSIFFLDEMEKMLSTQERIGDSIMMIGHGDDDTKFEHEEDTDIESSGECESGSVLSAGLDEDTSKGTNSMISH